MINKKQLKSVERLLETQKIICNEYEKLYNSASEPQIRSEIQNIIASYKNYTDKLVKKLEEAYENR